jgi:aspartyl-tRNA(Asn)/glutamyl-tRNA(Gln) amidotransferase subunit B
MPDYEPVIGLEVHAQLTTSSKLFCGCSTRYGAPPNSQVCPVCMGLPGAMPTLNREAVELAVRVIEAFGGTVNRRSLFARKAYFYPDLPKGYQISQYNQPLGDGGRIEWFDVTQLNHVDLIRIHLEEDAGKLSHGSEDDLSLVDLNRCGIPLIEIVSAPDLKSPAAAHDCLQALSQILQYLDVCTGDMEKGAFRCDANVSVRAVGAQRPGTRTEIKNINSFKFVRKALEFEVSRQVSILESGGEIDQETLLWDENRNECVAMRRKEYSEEYRYFPEPDLLPLILDEEWLREIRSSPVELPVHKIARFIHTYELSFEDARVLTSKRSLAVFFEDVVTSGADAVQAANWIQTEFLRHLNDSGQDIRDIAVSPGQLASLLSMITDGKLSGKLAKTVFAEMIDSGDDPGRIVEQKSLRRIADEKELAPIVEMILQKEQKNVAGYRAGKTKLLSYFIGEVMKATDGMADPGVVSILLKRYLNGSTS